MVTSRVVVVLAECAETADLYVVMDGSGSIDQQNFNLMKEFTRELVQDLTVSTGRAPVCSR